MLESDWCCEHTDCNGLWFNEAYSMDQWLEALKIVATRYANVPAVAGMGRKCVSLGSVILTLFHGHGQRRGSRMGVAK